LKTLTFLGKTPTEALRKAQAKCGEDAIVIHTKKIADKSTNQTNMYEILIGIEEGSENSVQKENVVTYTAPASNENFKAQFYDFKMQINQMQESILQVQKSIWDPKSHLYDLIIPPEFVDIYNLFELNELDKEISYTILKKTIEQLPVKFKSNPKKINDFFKLILRRIIPIKYEVPLATNQKKIMMFVGPTGVGKTTTIAKLAARYAYKMPINYKVGIITLDSFRVGAIEQLKAYSNIMRLPLEVVKDSDDLSEAIARLKDCHYILIDTAGSSQYDVDKIELINEYQNKLQNNIVIEKTLVLPANIKASDLHEIFLHYAVVGINNLTFTKLDETKSFGNLVSFTHISKKSISFLSVGQNVPDDLLPADAGFLIDCFMNQSCKRG
jgi:flagellar biosynthesis protein FlhF